MSITYDLFEVAKNRPLAAPELQPVWVAVADIGPRVTHGAPLPGQHWRVPILGGAFRGAAGHEGLHGRVLPGGEDQQWLRPDGVKLLRATYEMETWDGVLLAVSNEVVIDESNRPERYAASRITIGAPNTGPYAWLGRRLFVGTLQSLRPEREAVLVRGFLVNA